LRKYLLLCLLAMKIASENVEIAIAVAMLSLILDPVYARVSCCIIVV
jgi:hypothetical protein